MNIADLYCLCTGKLVEMNEIDEIINIVGGWCIKYICPECKKEVHEGHTYSY